MAGGVVGVSCDVSIRIGNRGDIASHVIAERSQPIETADAGVTNDRRLIAKTIIGKPGYATKRVGRGDWLTV
jgi:hypothetical protein